MKAHDLAKTLLSLPNDDVAIGLLGITGHISGIDEIKTGSYPSPSWADDAGDPNRVIILCEAETSLNENEELTLDS